jgi:hypothetical protein
MSLTPAEIGHIVGLGQPVLCIDTCSILDVMRDPFRETTLATNIAAALRMIDAASETPPRLVVLRAAQVDLELLSNAPSVEDDAQRGLNRFRAHAKRIDDLAAVLGATPGSGTLHLQNHVAESRKLFDRWCAAGWTVQQTLEIAGKAMVRVNGAIAPASHGNQNAKDCLVIETYLRALQDLRAAGLTSPAVFLSSNTKDYCSTGSRLESALVPDFATVQMDYASTHQMAKHLLNI